MTYNTCLKLKQAGFPQEIPYGGAYYLAPDETVLIAAGLNDTVPTEKFSDVVKIPTLAELIAECGDRFGRLSLHGEQRNNWYASASLEGEQMYDATFAWGKSPEEAVANLYLALRK